MQRGDLCLPYPLSLYFLFILPLKVSGLLLPRLLHPMTIHSLAKLFLECEGHATTVWIMLSFRQDYFFILTGCRPIFFQLDTQTRSLVKCFNTITSVIPCRRSLFRVSLAHRFDFRPGQTKTYHFSAQYPVFSRNTIKSKVFRLRVRKPHKVIQWHGNVCLLSLYLSNKSDWAFLCSTMQEIFLKCCLCRIGHSSGGKSSV